MEIIGILLEIIISLMFLAVILVIFRQKKTQESVTFIFPFILFISAIEFVSIHLDGNLIYSPEKFNLLFFGLPPAVLATWMVGLFFAFFLTDRIFSHFHAPILVLALNDAFLVDLMNLVTNSTLTRFGWILYNKEVDYLVGGYLFGVPVWEFIGAFLALFLFSFGYRTFKKFEFKKRIIFTYSYIFSILIVRFFVYLIKF